MFKDQLSYLSFVTPWNAVKVIFLLGIILFIGKLFEYRNLFSKFLYKKYSPIALNIKTRKDIVYLLISEFITIEFIILISG